MRSQEVLRDNTRAEVSRGWFAKTSYVTIQSTAEMKANCPFKNSGD
jgi:hypothetical protein